MMDEIEDKVKQRMKEHQKRLVSDGEKAGLPISGEGNVGAQKPSWKKRRFRKGLSWRDRRKLKKHPEMSYLITMFFSNGTKKEFVIKTKKETFSYRGREYYLRYEEGWYNLTQNQYELNFFDDYAVPIDRKILRKGNKAFFSVTPENLKPIIDMNYVKVLAESGDLNKWVKMTAMFSLVLVLGFIILLFMVARQGKVLQILAGGG